MLNINLKEMVLLKRHIHCLVLVSERLDDLSPKKLLT